MGLIKKIIEERRLKKLEAIEREIERITDTKLAKHSPKQPSLKDSVIDPETHKFKLPLRNQFIKTDSSIFLLFLVCLITAALIATTAFYQIKMSGLNEDFTARVIEVEKLKNELTAKESNLSVVQQTLSIKEQREEELEDVFQEERTDLKNEIKILKSEKADLEADVSTLEKRVAELEAENEDLEEQIDALESQ